MVLPWLLLAADRLCERGTARDAALLGLGLGLAFLGGQPESGLIVSVATAAWVIYRLAGARPARGELVRRLLLGVAAAVLGAGLAAVMLLPLLEAIHQAITLLAVAAAAARAVDQRAVLPAVLGDPR